MNYSQQVQKVIDYIGQHLDEELTLDELCHVAYFSKYHFHRIFTGLTGLSLQQYIRWLRLKRAAHQLVFDKDKSILEIAMNAGFQSHQAFTRVFKQSCGISPSEFRKHINWNAWETPPYHLPERGMNKMNVVIKEMTKRRLAAVEHRASPEKLGESVNKLLNWAKSQKNELNLVGGESFGFAYDDPTNTPADEFRFDLCMTVPDYVKITGDVIEKQFPAGRYATVMHKGSRVNIGDAIYGLFRDWLPQSGEELGDLPCIFRYMNFDHEVAETELLTEICVLLK